MECPNCRLINPPDSAWCDCGYEFGARKRSRESGRTLPPVPESARFEMFGTTFQEGQIVRSPEGDDARRYMVLSWVITGVALLLVLGLLFLNRVALYKSLLILTVSAYVAWASYWGVVRVRNVWPDDTDSIGATIAVHIAAYQLGLFGLAIPIVLGILYGVPGGGIHEFLRQRKVIRKLPRSDIA